MKALEPDVTLPSSVRRGSRSRRQCGSTWIEGDRGYQGRLNMSSVCGVGGQSFFAFGEQRYGGKVARLSFGRAGDGVARVALRFGSDTVAVPMTGRWLLAEFLERPDEFLSYDGDGRVLEHRTFPSPPPGRIVGARDLLPLSAMRS